MRQCLLFPKITIFSQITMFHFVFNLEYLFNFLDKGMYFLVACKFVIVTVGNRLQYASNELPKSLACII